MFIVTINTENAAYEDTPGDEVARQLRELANRIENNGIGNFPIRDINGNTVGKAEFIEDEEGGENDE